MHFEMHGTMGFSSPPPISTVPGITWINGTVGTPRKNKLIESQHQRNTTKNRKKIKLLYPF